MNIAVKKEIVRLAEESPTEEICGIIYVSMHTVNVFPCRNIAENRHLFFIMDPGCYMECLKHGKPVGIYHSHISTPAAFAQDDIDGAEETALPLYVYSLMDKQFQEYIPPSYKVSLEGQMFIFGQQDCYSLVRDYYRQELGIYLFNYASDDQFLDEPTNIVMNNFQNEGFIDVKMLGDFKKHDLIVTSSSRNVPQHFAVYLGHNKIIHHPLGRLSRVDIFDPAFGNRIQLVLRHKNLIK